MVGAAGGSVAGDEDGAHLWIAFGGFELAGHSGKEAVEDELGFDSYDGVVGAGHAYVGDEGGPVGKDTGVGGGNVGVGAEDGGDAAVEVPAEGDLFAGGLGMDVEEDDGGGDLAEKLVGLAEGVVAGGHEDAALEVDNGVLLAGGEFALVEAEARSSGGVVGGAEDAAAAEVRIGGNGHVLEDLALVPDVVAGGDDVRSHVEDFFGERGGDAEAAGGVFAVDDEEVDGVGFDDVGEMLAYDVAAGGAEDVADEEDVHLEILHCGDVRSGTGRGGCVSLLGWQIASGFN